MVSSLVNICQWSRWVYSATTITCLWWLLVKVSLDWTLPELCLIMAVPAPHIIKKSPIMALHLMTARITLSSRPWPPPFPKPPAPPTCWPSLSNPLQCTRRQLAVSCRHGATQDGGSQSRAASSGSDGLGARAAASSPAPTRVLRKRDAKGRSGAPSRRAKDEDIDWDGTSNDRMDSAQGRLTSGESAREITTLSIDNITICACMLTLHFLLHSHLAGAIS